jgi:hypothetical protein
MHFLRNIPVVKSHPVLFPVVEQILPRPPTLRELLPLCIKDPNVAVRDPIFVGCCENRGENFGLRDQKFTLGCLHMMRKLCSGIRRIRTGEDTTCANDGEHQHAVVYLHKQ